MIHSEPLITVIIPTFRRPKSLRRAILSVLNQTFSAFQVCVYDDASNDDTKKVVTELAETDSRIKYYSHEQNLGALANFDYGLKQVNTPYFSFLSDDDLLLPHFFETALLSLNARPEVMFYAGLTIQVEGREIKGILKNGGQFGYFQPPNGLLEIVHHQLLWNSIVFRTKVVDFVGPLDLDVGGPADVDFEFRIAAHHPVIVSAEPSALNVLHAQNLYARSSDYRLYLPGFKRIMDRMMSDESLSLNTRTQFKNRLNAWLCDFFIGLAERASMKGESDDITAIAEILTRFCERKAKVFLLLGRLKLKESSKLAFCLASWMEWCLRFVFLPNIIKKIRLKQLQREYGKYLRCLDT